MPQQAPTITAYMITYDAEHQEHVFPISSNDLRSGDLLLLTRGEQIPAPCKILSGEIWVDQDGTLTQYTHPAIAPKGGLVQSGQARAYVYIIL
jgi:cation transport ATPase